MNFNIIIKWGNEVQISADKTIEWVIRYKMVTY